MAGDFRFSCKLGDQYPCSYVAGCCRRFEHGLRQGVLSSADQDWRTLDGLPWCGGALGDERGGKGCVALESRADVYLRTSWRKRDQEKYEFRKDYNK